MPASPWTGQSTAEPRRAAALDREGRQAVSLCVFRRRAALPQLKDAKWYATVRRIR